MIKLNIGVILFCLITIHTTGAQAQPSPLESGYAAINGLDIYYEKHGEGEPLILLHGGLGSGSMFYNIIPGLTENRQIITVDLQGHGRTADIDRPIRHENFGDDIAGLIRHLGLEKADVAGYSMGAGAALRTAIQHPEVVNRLILISISYSRDGFYPEILEAQQHVGADMAESMKGTPMYEVYAEEAPQPEQFPKLLDKMAEFMSIEYDWSDEIVQLSHPVLLVFADADMFSTSHMAEFYELLGGGQRDAGWDGSLRSEAQLAILPDLTHYNIFMSPVLVQTINRFLDPDYKTDAW